MNGVGRILTIVALVLVVCVLRASAQTSAVINPATGLSIEQAIEEALRQEPALAAARAEIGVAAGERRQAALRPNPDVMFEQREQVRGMDRQTNVSVEMPLDLFARGPRMLTADRRVGAAEAAVRERERQVAIAVRAQYGMVLEAVRRLEIAEEVLAASRRTYELLRGRAEEGAAPPLERDIALVELRRLESTRELATGRLAMALAGMKRVLGRAPEGDLSLRASLEMAVEQDAAHAVRTRSGPRADVVEAEVQAAVAAARTRQADQEARPSFSIFGGYMRMNQGFSQSGFNPLGGLEPIQGTFNNVAAGVRVSIPLFNRGQGSLAAARAGEIAAAETVKARRLDAAAEAAAAVARLDAARRAAASYSTDVRGLARRNLDVMRETHALGRVALFDVLNEQRRYLEFQSTYTDVLAELFAAVTALWGATGDVR